MKRLRLAALAVLLIAFPLAAQHGDGGGPGQPAKKAFATIDFEALNTLVGKSRGTIRLALVAANGVSYKESVSFDLSENAAANVCATFSASASEVGWTITKDGKRLTIYAHVKEDGTVSPLSRIAVSFGGDLVGNALPKITATKNVKIGESP